MSECVYVGNEEEESDSDIMLRSFDTYQSILRSFDTYQTLTSAAANLDKERKVSEGLQSLLNEDSSITQSQTSPKCIPMLRNMVSLYYTVFQKKRDHVLKQNCPFTKIFGTLITKTIGH